MDIFQGHMHCANERDRPHVSFDADKHENTVSVHFATQTCAEAAQQRLNINSLTQENIQGYILDFFQKLVEEDPRH